MKQVEQLKQEKAELQDKNEDLIQKLASKESAKVETVAKTAASPVKTASSPVKPEEVVAPLVEERADEVFTFICVNLRGFETRKVRYPNGLKLSSRQIVAMVRIQDQFVWTLFISHFTEMVLISDARYSAAI